MKKFLKEVAEKIVKNEHYGAQSVVILPNRRSEVFLKQEIKKITTTNIWLPEFYPIDEFINTASGLQKADSITIFFELYKMHQKIEGSNAKTIDEFLTWAPIMLADFNDIDSAMVNASEIFKHISAIKAIQQWNPDGRPLTSLQQNYLHFINTLFDYYTSLNNQLLNQNIGYQGMIYNYVAKNAANLFKKQHWNNFMFVGLNALSKSELEVLNHINNTYKTTFIWDVDSYYFGTNKLSSTRQEAGTQIQKVVEYLKINQISNINDNLSKSEKTINLLGVPKNIGQVKFVGQELQKQFASANKNETDLLDTVVVLANEELLVPLLNSLPEIKPTNQKHYNVTLGYPLKNSRVDDFFSTWIDIVISQSKNNGKMQTLQLISLITNPVLSPLVANIEANKFISQLIKSNTSLITYNEVVDVCSSLNKNALQVLIDLVNITKNDSVIDLLESLKTALIKIIANATFLNILIKEQLKQLVIIISKVIALSADDEAVVNLFAVKKIVKQLISVGKISLVGEPLNGIQIMGLLETRTLDFDNVYILSTNEGVIPKTDSINSFIPMDVRGNNKLPMPSDNTDVYAYHFYRLLQRAKNISLIYNSDPAKMGSGEKSRFILQIENELAKINPKITLNSSIINTSIANDVNDNNSQSNIVVEKNDEILKVLSNIAVTGYSPSVLSSYISCKLKFYFSHVLKVNITTTLEQAVEANTFGKVVHGVLENIYKPMLGAQIKTEVLKSNLPKLRQLLTNQFAVEYTNGNIVSGKNLLIYEVALNYISSFLKWDINNLKKKPSVLQSVEAKLNTIIECSSTKVAFKGFIDRVDIKNDSGIIQIIDYKTGKVAPADLKIADFNQISTNPKYAKAFQVVFYAWLYDRNLPAHKIETGIISLRSMSQGFISLNIEKFNEISKYFENFTNQLTDLVDEIMDVDVPFVQTDDAKRCTYCNYKQICNK